MWSDGTQLLYRNYRENAELRSVPVEQFDYFIPTKEEESPHTPGMTLMEHYLRNKSFGLKHKSSDQVTNFQHVNLSSLIEIDSGNTSTLCSFIAGHPLILGQWFLIECDHFIQSDYVICEKYANKRKSNQSAPSEIARQYRITDRRVSCRNAKQFFFGYGHRCYELLHTTWSSINKKCVKGDYRNILLKYSALRNVWSKWAYLLLTEFGTKSESNDVACVKKSCKNCVAQNVLSWRHSYSCNVNKRGLGHWLCETKPTYLTMKQQCISNQHAEWYECDDGTCILGHYQCDGIQHCISNSDEIGCSWQTQSPTAHHRYHQKMMWLQDTNDELVPLYKWYLQNKIAIHMQAAEDFSENINVMDNGCKIGWSRCSHRDNLCFPNAHVCVFERDIYGNPLYCDAGENVKSCTSFTLEALCPTMFRCKSSYCIPFHMVRIHT